MRSRRRWLILCAGAILVAVGVIASDLAAAGRRRWRVVMDPTPQLDVAAWSPARGVLSFEARARITNMIRHPVLWWRVELRRSLSTPEGEDAEVVWEHQFAGPDDLVRATKGVEAVLVLPRQQVPFVLAPGAYYLFIEVLEDAGEADIDGTRISDTHGTIGNSTDLVEVR
jgi:hypothetical protein